MTASFVLKGLDGKQIPSIGEMFPEIFQEQDDLKKQQEDLDYKRAMLYKEQMLDFATAHNKKRHLAKEGEKV